jgi:hypothetical protein
MVRRQIRCEIPGAWLSPAHLWMMPNKGSKVNPDPSRLRDSLVDPGAVDIHAAGRDDRAALPDFAGAGDWRLGAVGVALAGDKPSCNSVVRDHNLSRGKISRGIRYAHKPVAGEPLRREPPCLFAGGARQRRQIRGKLEPASIGAPNEGSP